MRGTVDAHRDRGRLRSRLRFAPALVAALLAVVAAALPAPGEGPTAGMAGVDTSLPLTDSAVKARGRGPFAQLEVTVNQTRSLANQAISVTWTGGSPTIRAASRYAGHYLQIMQCWGDDDGSVPGNPGPPPEQCVQGASDAVYGGRNMGNFPAGGYALERIVSRRDFPAPDPGAGVLEESTGYVWKPFRAVDGTVVTSHYDSDFSPAVEGGNYWLNPYFNAITTNEIAGGRTGPNGTGAELFEVTTGLESTGLGCGQRVLAVVGGQPREPKCWLVIVPRGDPAVENEGTPFSPSIGVATSPLAPSAWQHRIAVPLEFNPVDSSCTLADDQRQIGGSELLEPAVASWQRVLCATPGRPPYAYSTVGDATARQQLVGGAVGAPGMIVVSRPVDPAAMGEANPVLHAPVGASGVVIGFNIERNPRSDAGSSAEDLRGIRVAELNLTPRLVAKLLTQSYRTQTAIKGRTPYEWAAGNPPHLALDPDFLRFNPEFELLQTAGGKNLGGLMMPSRTSDAARQVWAWVLADPEARAWLDGAADEWGMRVNPVFATTGAANANGLAFGDPVPESFPKADPHCYEAPPMGAGGSVLPPPLCGTDWLPYTQSLRDAARLTRAADDGARTIENPFAVSSDQVYRSDGPMIAGSRAFLSLTDTPSAVRYGVQVARLSRAGDAGPERRFVAPDEEGLRAGVQAMAVGDVPSVIEPDPLVRAPEAYPLTSLSYAAIAPLSLDAPAREDYAAFVEYAAGPGQVQGVEVGRLPLGFVPLPAALRAEARDVAAKIRTLAPAEEEPDPAPSPPPPAAGGGMSVGDPFPGGGGGGGVDGPGPSGVDDPAGTGDPPGADEEAAAAAPEPSDEPVERSRRTGLATPILALARSRYAVPVLGVVALISALMALEITKRPRRAPGSPVGAAAGGGLGAGRG